MLDRDPDVEAEITFLSTIEGGRRFPVYSGYRPAHRVLPDYLTTGTHQYISRTQVLPGETVTALITFISPEHYPHCLSVDQVIDVQEGGRLVGRARILRVLNAELQRAG
jgi:elongation factor Tu